MATAKKYLVYRVSDGVCVNVIVWDGEQEYSVGEGLALEICPAGSFAGLGWVRQSDGEWVAPQQEN